MTINIDVKFSSGVGTLGVRVFKNKTGKLIEHGAINNSGIITLIQPDKGDLIAVDGVCTNSADISFDVNTNPATPHHYTAGTIHDGFKIL